MLPRRITCAILLVSLLLISLSRLAPTAHAASPDLTVDNVWLEAASNPGQAVTSVAPDDQFNIVASVRNIGHAPASGYYLDVYYDSDYGRGGPDNIAVSEVQTWYVGPLTAQTGNHTSRWIMNPDKLIAESNYGNNEMDFTFTIGSPITNTTTTTSTSSNSTTVSTTQTTMTTTSNSSTTSTYYFTTNSSSTSASSTAESTSTESVVTTTTVTSNSTPSTAQLTSPSSWIPLVGLTPDSLASAVSSDQLFLAARGMENGIWYRSADVSGVWSGWSRVPGFTDVGPAVAVFNNRLYFVCKEAGTSNIWFGYYPLSGSVVSGSFSGWTLLPGPTPAAVALAADGSYLYVAAAAPDGSIWHQRMDAGGSWSGWVQIPGFTDVSPAMVVFNSRLYFVCKEQMSSNVWYGYVDLATYPTGWSGWTFLPGRTPGALTLTVSSDHLYVAARGTENGIWYRSMDASGAWSDWSRIPGFTDASPGIAIFNAKLYFVCKGAASNNIWYS